MADTLVRARFTANDLCTTDETELLSHIQDVIEAFSHQGEGHKLDLDTLRILNVNVQEQPEAEPTVVYRWIVRSPDGVIRLTSDTVGNANDLLRSNPGWYLTNEATRS